MSSDRDDPRGRVAAHHRTGTRTARIGYPVGVREVSILAGREYVTPRMLRLTLGGPGSRTSKPTRPTTTSRSCSRITDGTRRAPGAERRPGRSTGRGRGPQRASTRCEGSTPRRTSSTWTSCCTRAGSPRPRRDRRRGGRAGSRSPGRPERRRFRTTTSTMSSRSTPPRCPAVARWLEESPADVSAQVVIESDDAAEHAYPLAGAPGAEVDGWSTRAPAPRSRRRCAPCAAREAGRSCSPPGRRGTSSRCARGARDGSTRCSPDTGSAELPGLRTDLPTRAAILFAALALLIVAAVAGVSIGTRSIAPAEIWRAFTGFAGTDDHLIVREIRVPRTILGIFVGAALGAAGALIQTLTRNPLAEPGMLGRDRGRGARASPWAAVLGPRRVAVPPGCCSRPPVVRGRGTRWSPPCGRASSGTARCWPGRPRHRCSPGVSLGHPRWYSGRLRPVPVLVLARWPAGADVAHRFRCWPSPIAAGRGHAGDQAAEHMVAGRRGRQHARRSHCTDRAGGPRRPSPCSAAPPRPRPGRSPSSG